jgi:hypothetical protein
MWNLTCFSLETGARLVQGLCQTYHQLRKLFWTHQIVLLGDKAQVNAHFGRFGDSANLDQGLVLGLHRMYHRLGIILDATDGTPR